LLLCSGIAIGCNGEQRTAERTHQADAAKLDDETRLVQRAPQRPPTGSTLFAQHRAGCHGEKGDGNGPAAAFLFPKPRDFRAGRFRLISTVNGVPSDDDLQAVLERGMPGSSMPPWPRLSEAERKLLTEQIRQFHREGMREQYIARLKEEYGEENPEVDEQELAALIQNRTVPSEASPTPAIGEPDTASIARGRELYLGKGCASCHGVQGKGDGQEIMVDSEGLPTRPRDLTRGIFKGEHDSASIYRRIALGMPGTPMPSSPTLQPPQITDLVHFIRSLSDEASRQAAIAKRERLLATSVAALPTSESDAAWKDAPPSTMLATPLWWRNEADPKIAVQAMHDGKSIAFRIRWRDDTEDMRAYQADRSEDKLAVELYRGPVEPFLGMGSKESPVDLWMWRATAPDEAKSPPRLVVDQYPFSEPRVESAEYARRGTKLENQPDVSLPARAVGNQIGGRENSSSLTGGGPGSVTFFMATNQRVRSSGAWKDGVWTVVMQRPLAAAAGEGVSLAAGETVLVALAVWDGGQNDRNGQKRFTIWQDLELERN
jgi:mono/diheme cytochrome c family protein